MTRSGTTFLLLIILSLSSPCSVQAQATRADSAAVLLRAGYTVYSFSRIQSERRQA